MTHTPVAERDTAFQPEFDQTKVNSLYGQRPPVPKSDKIEPSNGPTSELPLWRRILITLGVIGVTITVVGTLFWVVNSVEKSAYSNGFDDGYHQGQDDGYKEGFTAGQQSDIAGGADTSSEEPVAATSVRFTFCEAQLHSFDPSQVILVTDGDDLLVPYSLYIASQVAPMMQASVEFDDTGAATKMVPLPNVEPNYGGCRSAMNVPSGPVPVG